MTSALPPDTEFRSYRCPKCRWSPVLPKGATPTGDLWCLFCGQDTLMTSSPATREEYERQLVTFRIDK